MTDRLDWPADLPRTDREDRKQTRKFEVSLGKTFDELEAELGRLDVDDHRYSVDAQQRQSDQRPYKRASPDDPGFVLRWSMEGAQYAVACDRYARLRDNVRAAGLYVREKRLMEQRPVVTGESEFANARLPSADDAVTTTEPPHDVLGVDPDADAGDVRVAFRELAIEHHPDRGGDPAEFRRIQQAREAILDE